MINLFNDRDFIYIIRLKNYYIKIIIVILSNISFVINIADNNNC